MRAPKVYLLSAGLDWKQRLGMLPGLTSLRSRGLGPVALPPPARETVAGSDRFRPRSQSGAVKVHTPHVGAMRSRGGESFNPPECLFSCL